MASTITIPKDVHESLRKLRFRKATDNAAVIYKINKKDLIVEEDSTIEAFETVEDLADELPSNSPRFIVVSYQLTHPDGRTSTPLFLLNWNPSSGSPDMKTLHASGLSLFQRTADVARVVEVREEEELTKETVEAVLLA